MDIPRMRIAKEIAKEIKALDPNTGLSESSIRRLVKEGKLESVQIGNRHLINLDSVIEFLNTPPPVTIINTTPDEKSHVPMDRMQEFKKNIGMR
ncbi:helix-turn-helix domain-containing protein [Acetobacterium tundrae]|uniref:Helix-turn-helix domain-containing protein n=1 Tax=Acetobacterium tundrae TaxID=132932 RepID=A0ABR6WL09_9FIRM|nr:helix-turn-helix domain-containing protein [Acetobacterium tundrae]MBC3797165.1 hypothetical protein [Acetobacterium tundrae]